MKPINNIRLKYQKEQHYSPYGDKAICRWCDYNITSNQFKCFHPKVVVETQQIVNEPCTENDFKTCPL